MTWKNSMKVQGSTLLLADVSDNFRNMRLVETCALKDI